MKTTIHPNKLCVLIIQYIMILMCICIVSVPEYQIVPIHQVNKRSLPDDRENLIEESTIEKNEDSSDQKSTDQKHIKLKAFGKPYTLNLQPTEGLLKKGKLKIWTIEPNATAQHGIEYVEHPDEVSRLFF